MAGRGASGASIVPISWDVQIRVIHGEMPRFLKGHEVRFLLEDKLP
jgi:hypothetical protein